MSSSGGITHRWTVALSEERQQTCVAARIPTSSGNSSPTSDMMREVFPTLAVEVKRRGNKGEAVRKVSSGEK